MTFTVVGVTWGNDAEFVDAVRVGDAAEVVTLVDIETSYAGAGGKVVTVVAVA